MKATYPAAPEIKLLAHAPAVTTQDGEFEGYASLFDVPDLTRDVVRPGAFAGSLTRRGAAGVRMLWQHDPGEPIGSWLDIREDRRGLFVRGRLNLAVARAREVHALIRERAVDGLSIGFRVQRSTKERATGRRILEQVDLWEISIVTFPMLPAARVSQVKGVDGLALAIRKAADRLFGRPDIRAALL
ncbi:MAG: HK97 family phage prohead protease [Salinarimonadaceae bacterium]|nr:MAG: HK97 family phage prohead protease [Salinarimonadaceae bacterium]